MYQKKCIRTTPLNSASEPICGNGVSEHGEQCDCGLSTQCDDWNCISNSCTYRIQPLVILLFEVLFFTLSTVTVPLLLRHTGIRMNCFKAHKKRELNFGHTMIQALNSSPYQSRKHCGFGKTVSIVGMVCSEHILVKLLILNNIMTLVTRFEDSGQPVNYSSYPGQPGVPTCPSYPSFAPINRVTVYFLNLTQVL
uniref:EB domain-containing protein n=1 Tax=Angiostrongylus cantonensis TaxID=6313 RepID=A0A0K0D1T0_ANGCA